MTTNDNRPAVDGLAGSAEPLAQSAATSDSQASGSITVVSGLPRSGTSLVMQMLEKEPERRPQDLAAVAERLAALAAARG